MLNNKRPRKSSIALYSAVALLTYGVVGALFNDVYIPSRRGSGIHFHNDALPSVVLAIAFVSFKLAMQAFDGIRYYKSIQRALSASALVAFSFGLHAVVSPKGMKLATTRQCEATFEKLSAFAGEMSAAEDSTRFIRDRGLRCASEPILETFHECVARARIPTDVNPCHGEADRLWRRPNAS